MGKGGGQQQQQPTSSTVTNTNLPAYAQPYVEKLFGQAGALTDINQNPYQQYGGQRVADFAPMQQQAFNTIGGMQVSPQTQQATGLAGAAGLGSLGAGQNYNRMATDPGAIQAFMSPYQQNVTDYQKQQAVMDYGRQLPGMGAAASNKGAFGGSRQAIVEGEGQRNLQNQLAGIQATGSQNAFQNAQQAQQFGSSLGLQGYNQALQGASTLGQLGQNQYQQQSGINAAQLQAGAQQQAFNQQGLSNQYQEFLNRQNYPYQQLGFMSDIIRGTPTGGVTTKQESQVAPSMFGQIAGLGLAGYGLNNAFKKEGGIIQGYKHGGSVRHFESGGITSLLTDPETEIAAKSKLPPINQAMALAKFMLPAINKMHQPIARPSMTTVAEDMAREILSRSQQPQDAPPQMPQVMPQGQQPQQAMPPQGIQQAMPSQEVQQDAPQMPQEQPNGGLTSLPINNFAPENYDGGGIIAFQSAGVVPAANGDSDFVSSPTGLGIIKSEADTSEPLDMSSQGLLKMARQEQERLRAQYTQPTMAGEVASAREAQQQALRAAGITGNYGDKRQKQLEDLQLTEAARKKEALNNFIISTGLGMASEASKYGRPQSGILSSITQPLSVGAAQAFPGFMSEQKEIRSLTNTRDKELAELENMRYNDATGIAKIAQASFEKKEDRIKAIDLELAKLTAKSADLVATKEAALAAKPPNDMAAYVRDYVASAIENGSKKSVTALSTEARDAFLKLKGAYDPRYAGVGVQARGQDIQANTAAVGQEGVDNRAAQASADQKLKSTQGTIAILQAQEQDAKNARAGKPTTIERDLRESIFQEALRNIRSPTRPGQLPRVAAPVATPKPAAPDSVTVGNKTYARPADFTDAQWRDYKKFVRSPQ